VRKTKAEGPLESLALLSESKTNPRRIFEDTALKELADYVPGHIIGLLFRYPFCGCGSGTLHCRMPCTF
jgi:hypothetical protein